MATEKASDKEVLFTTIQIKVSTRDKLKEIGKMDETYDDLLLRLIGLEKKVNK